MATSLASGNRSIYRRLLPLVAVALHGSRVRQPLVHLMEKGERSMQAIPVFNWPGLPALARFDLEGSRPAGRRRRLGTLQEQLGIELESSRLSAE
jgi:hypothetical protein